MLRFAGESPDGRKLIGLGITSANVARMAKGEPILVKTEDFGLSSEKIDFVIFYGKDLETLEAQFAPLIGKNTKVYRDPKLDQGSDEKNS